uniref:NADPH-dependent FMN reductase-like domain-containing protein n=2 Tax=Corethron hystrix TaxID=216773 RepID=A0A7S1FMR8_9STRA|mmetsp:Transcript_13601/g.30009  ORF Transcript_13601/g.30009 Transcript_13601/m.30009 type:complete len:232 (+) Transcript_13601:108-803(+)
MEQKATANRRTLKTVLFMGSARDITPPWGGTSRTGDGILEWVKKEISKRSSSLGGIKEITHELTVYDPIEVFGEGGALQSSGAEIRTPHFFFKPGDAPSDMDAMAQKINEADCYLVLTPEYNHSVTPAISGMMGHFGGSKYAFKPSGLITYSVSPYGGARGAVALRPFLSELGCLPVSAMACFSMVGDIFEQDGTPKDENHRQLKQLDKVLTQLEWYAIACSNQRDASGVP